MARRLARPRHRLIRRRFTWLRSRPRRIGIVGLACVLALGLLGVPGIEAATESWQQALRGLAGKTPSLPSAGGLAAAPLALDPADPAAQMRRKVETASGLAREGYLGDGTRFVSPSSAGMGFATQASAVTALTRELKKRTKYDAGRTGALVGVLSAGIRTARISYADAVRLVGGPAGADAQSEPDADAEVDDPVPLAERVRQRCESAPPPDARRLLGAARTHLERMDAALTQARPRVAVREAAAAYLSSHLALRAVGVDQLRNGNRPADADGDQLPDSLELVLGAHPLRRDSDSDGLDDGPEAALLASVLRLDKADTDGDGLRDDREDSDGDTLTNAAEAAGGTDPLAADTDGDTLPDAAEKQHRTKPTVADTDGDGLSDGAEVRAGLNPLAKDSDRDGVPDGKEVVDQPVTGPDGVTVAVRSVGDLASTVQIRKVAADTPDTAGALGRIGSAYDFVAPAGGPALVQARISLPYDPAALPAGTDVNNLRVFTFDEVKKTWVPAADQQAVDSGKHTVTVTVAHFSRYALFDIVNWKQQWTSVATNCSPGSGSVPVDVALAIDSSGSMIDNDPQGLRGTAAKSFVDALADGDRAGVIDFDGVASVRQGLTGDKAALKAAIDTIDANGGTDIGAGVDASLGVLPQPTAGRANAIILLTDGQGSWNDALIDRAKTMKTVIFTIGLSASADAALLRRIAEATGGKYFGVDSADQLPQVFRSLSGCVKDPTPGGVADPDCQSADGDNDGLPDCVETGGYAIGTGTVVSTRPDNPDTDGDGIPDGQEAGSAETSPADGSVRYRAAISDPTKANTDGDSLDDATEFDATTSAWSADTDHDGVDDPDELGLGTDPRDGDTDGDGLTDGYEVTHADDGLDPRTPDQRTGKAEYIKRFLQGVVCGDVTWSWIGCGANDSLARLIGSIVGSFIPFVDIRDVIANLIKGDFVGAGLSFVGLVPYVGDAAAVVAKVGKYISKYPGKAPEATRAIANIGSLNSSTKAAALRPTLPQWGALRGVGVSEASIVRLAKGATKLDDLTAAMASTLRKKDGPLATTRVAVAVKTADTKAHKVAELNVQNLYKQVQPGWTPVPNNTVNKRIFRTNAEGRNVYHREADIVDINGTRVEVKSGFVKRKNRNSDVCEQARKDREAVDAQEIREVLWHFVPSSTATADSAIGLGPSAEVLGCLSQYRIPFILHFP